jgi:hypothetical protein
VNPLTEGIVAGVIANGLTEIISLLAPPSASKQRQERAIAQILTADPKINEILQKAVITVAKSVHFKDEKQTEKLRLFFLSPEAEAIVRQLFGMHFVPGMKSKSEATLRSEFSLSLSLYLGAEPDAVRQVANPF